MNDAICLHKLDPPRLEFLLSQTYGLGLEMTNSKVIN